MKGKITIDAEFCKGCELCIANCPKKCIIISDKLNAKGYFVAEFKSEDCTGCATCALVCPDAAIEVYRE